MQHLLIALLLAVTCFPVLSAENNSGDKHDYVKIGYIPARYDAYAGSPYKSLKAEAASTSFNKKQEIKSFYEKLKLVASRGITSNSTRLHMPAVYLEAKYKGDRVRLSYCGETNINKFKEYEAKWHHLHDELFSYLTYEISPNNRIEQTQ